VPYPTVVGGEVTSDVSLALRCAAGRAPRGGQCEGARSRVARAVSGWVQSLASDEGTALTRSRVGGTKAGRYVPPGAALVQPTARAAESLRQKVRFSASKGRRAGRREKEPRCGIAQNVDRSWSGTLRFESRYGPHPVPEGVGRFGDCASSDGALSTSASTGVGGGCSRSSAFTRRQNERKWSSFPLDALGITGATFGLPATDCERGR
jgi:hypothetical protein